MRKQVGDPAFAPPVFNQVPLAHAVDARSKMFEAQVSQVVAAGDQEMIVGVMANAGESACFPDNPTVEFDDLRTELQGSWRLRHQVEESWRVGPGGERDRAQVFTGDQRAIGQVRQGYSLKRGEAVFITLALERRRELPFTRQPQAQAWLNVIAGESLGIHHARAPVEYPDQVITKAQVAGGLRGGLVADGVEQDRDLAHAVRHIALDAKRLELVALPFQFLAVGSLNSQAPHVVDGTIRSVGSGHPLGIPKFEPASLARNLDS